MDHICNACNRLPSSSNICLMNKQMVLSGSPSLSLGFAICLGGRGLSEAQFPHLLNNAVGMGDSEAPSNNTAL